MKSNILGVYQNKSDFFQVCDKYYYSTTFDPLQRTGTLLVKGKGLPRSRRTPTRLGFPQGINGKAAAGQPYH